MLVTQAVRHQNCDVYFFHPPTYLCNFLSRQPSLHQGNPLPPRQRSTTKITYPNLGIPSPSKQPPPPEAKASQIHLHSVASTVFTDSRTEDPWRKWMSRRPENPDPPFFLRSPPIRYWCCHSSALQDSPASRHPSSCRGVGFSSRTSPSLTCAERSCSSRVS